MAIMKQFTCRQCKQAVHQSCRPNAYPTVCESCEKTNADSVKALALANRAAMTLEERIALLEKFEYDHGLVRHGYIEPPRF